MIGFCEAAQWEQIMVSKLYSGASCLNQSKDALHDAKGSKDSSWLLISWRYILHGSVTLILFFSSFQYSKNIFSSRDLCVLSARVFAEWRFLCKWCHAMEQIHTAASAGLGPLPITLGIMLDEWLRASACNISWLILRWWNWGEGPRQAGHLQSLWLSVLQMSGCPPAGISTCSVGTSPYVTRFSQCESWISIVRSNSREKDYWVVLVRKAVFSSFFIYVFFFFGVPSRCLSHPKWHPLIF